jgi:Bardet-Biedl syndrome 7 protein
VIAIAKENLTRMANYRRTAVEESIAPINAAVHCFFLLMSEKLEYQQSLERKVQLVDAIHELSLQENNPVWLSAEYREILAQQESIRREFKSRTRALEYLCGIITDLFVDWHRIQGNTDVRRKLPQLQQLIVSSNVQALIKYFLE